MKKIKTFFKIVFKIIKAIITTITVIGFLYCLFKTFATMYGLLTIGFGTINALLSYRKRDLNIPENIDAPMGPFNPLLDSSIKMFKNKDEDCGCGK